MRARPAPTAGYSGTPLIDKLGIKRDARIQLVAPPDNLSALLGAMPAGAMLVSSGPLDFSVLFATEKSQLVKGFPRLRDRLVPNGMLWVAWPKKTSGVKTDLTEGVVRTVGLELGLVDVKVCAIDNTWSGLKFVRRLKDR
ncbi:MAG: DUF3052 domain-containing protein [Gemmatimonadales bacterium]